MVCCGGVPVGGEGSSGPKPAESCAAMPSGIGTAAKSGVVGADSSRRDRARMLTVAEARIGRGFMRENSVGAWAVFSALPCTLLRIDANWGGLVMWVGVREIGGLVGLRWAEVVGVGGGGGAVWLLRIRSRARA